MIDTHTDLLDECDGLRRRLEAAESGADAAIDKAAAMLDAALESADCDAGLAALDAARRAFYELPEDVQSALLNGWSAAGPRPPRQDLLEALELAYVRRVLSIAVTEKTIIPAHEWALRDGSVVRVEIPEGATLEQVTVALDRVMGTLRELWEFARLELGAVVIAKTYQGIDLRKAPDEALRRLQTCGDRTAFEG
jgi:hypothetical protein